MDHGEKKFIIKSSLNSIDRWWFLPLKSGGEKTSVTSEAGLSEMQ